MFYSTPPTFFSNYLFTDPIDDKLLDSKWDPVHGRNSAECAGQSSSDSQEASWESGYLIKLLLYLLCFTLNVILIVSLLYVERLYHDIINSLLTIT